MLSGDAKNEKFMVFEGLEEGSADGTLDADELDK